MQGVRGEGEEGGRGGRGGKEGGKSNLKCSQPDDSLLTDAAMINGRSPYQEIATVAEARYDGASPPDYRPCGCGARAFYA